MKSPPKSFSHVPRYYMFRFWTMQNVLIAMGHREQLETNFTLMYFKSSQVTCTRLFNQLDPWKYMFNQSWIHNEIWQGIWKHQILMECSWISNVHGEISARFVFSRLFQAQHSIDTHRSEIATCNWKSILCKIFSIESILSSGASIAVL